MTMDSEELRRRHLEVLRLEESQSNKDRVTYAEYLKSFQGKVDQQLEDEATNDHNEATNDHNVSDKIAQVNIIINLNGNIVAKSKETQIDDEESPGTNKRHFDLVINVNDNEVSVGEKSTKKAKNR